MYRSPELMINAVCVVGAAVGVALGALVVTLAGATGAIVVNILP